MIAQIIIAYVVVRLLMWGGLWVVSGVAVAALVVFVAFVVQMEREDREHYAEVARWRAVR